MACRRRDSRRDDGSWMEYNDIGETTDYGWNTMTSIDLRDCNIQSRMVGRCI